VADLQAQLQPDTEETPRANQPTPEDTSQLPAVEPAHRSRLHRATNLLALGQVHEAAALCREELAETPDSLDAMALLAMAEEQAGNRTLAIELLEELLRLDPTRIAEAQHLEELRQELEELESEQPTPEEQEENLRRLQPIALIVLAGAAVCLVASLALLLVVRHRAAQVEARYRTAMQAGEYYYRSGYYPEAMWYFAQAAQIKPHDGTARQWWYTAAQQASRSTSNPSVALPSFNPANPPFPPVPLGPTAPPPTTSSSPPTPSPSYEPPPPVRLPPRPVGTEPGFEPAPLPETPSQEPITPPVPVPQSPGAGATPQTPATPATPETPTEKPAEPQPMIKIETVERPAGASRTSARQRGDNLRAEGDRLYREGAFSAAAKAYRSAISAYEAARNEHPEQRRALDSTISSLQAKVDLCEKQAH